MKTIEFSYKSLRAVSFGYLLLPVLLFLAFSVKLIFSVPVMLVLAAVYLFAIRESNDNGKNAYLDLPNFALEKDNLLL